MQKIITFLKEVKTETFSIKWPTRETLFELTLVVVLVSLAVGAFLGGFDYLLTRALSLLTT